MLNNSDVRKIAKDKGVKIWEIADALNISEPTMTRKLRHELSAAEKQEIISLIDQIAAEKKKSA